MKQARSCLIDCSFPINITLNELTPSFYGSMAPAV
jgi:hypothetical protein